MSEASLIRLRGPAYPKVSLMAPSGSGYLLLCAEVDRRPPFGYRWESRGKRALLHELREAAGKLSARAETRDASLFKAWLVPPGRGAYLRERPDIRPARFDVVLLTETASPEAAEALAATAQWEDAVGAARRAARRTEVLIAANARRIGPVDHRRDGIFLFNFFHAASLDQNLAVWEYTAGWFQRETGLDNSTLLVPLAAHPAATVVNHCRWERSADILPALLKPSFRRYVLAHFQANRAAAQPILYRLA